MLKRLRESEYMASLSWGGGGRGWVGVRVSPENGEHEIVRGGVVRGCGMYENGLGV